MLESLFTVSQHDNIRMAVQEDLEGGQLVLEQVSASGWLVGAGICQWLASWSRYLAVVERLLVVV